VVARFQGWQPMSPSQALAFLEEMAAMATVPQAPAGDPWPVGAWLQLGIARSADDTLVGDIGLLRETPAHVQLGFTLARHAQGRGWAQAVLAPLCSQVLPAAGFVQLRALCDSRNTPSLRLLHRLGFAETARHAVHVHGEACTDVVLERATTALPGEPAA
jgi:aminoglycoside 6'-N-acetyltransferase